MKGKTPGECRKAMMQLFGVRREFCYVLVFKKCNRYSAWTGMGADGAANGKEFQCICSIAPDLGAVLYIFLSQIIRETAVCQRIRLLEVDAAAVLNQFAKQVVSFF